MQIHEPSPVSADLSNSALKPGNTVSDSAGVACGAPSTLPQGATPICPKLTAGFQSLAAKLTAAQPFVSTAELSQLLSVTMNKPKLLGERTSSFTNTAAGPVAPFLPRTARTFVPSRMASVTSNFSGLLPVRAVGDFETV